MEGYYQELCVMSPLHIFHVLSKKTGVGGVKWTGYPLDCYNYQSTCVIKRDWANHLKSFPKTDLCNF